MDQTHQSPQVDIHIKLVDSWEKKNEHILTADKRAQLFGIAIQAIEQRTLRTLSSSTLMVVIDRVLKQSIEKFPLLIEVKIDSKGMNFEELFNNKIYKSEEQLASLRYLLVELLRVLGRMTADILTGPLHKELLKVTGVQDETANH